MTAVHLILLVMRLDDLTTGVNHVYLTLSAFNFRLVGQLARMAVRQRYFGGDLLR